MVLKHAITAVLKAPLLWVGQRLAAYLNRPRSGYVTFAAHDAQTLEAVMRPGDVLLVEGELRISSVIKTLTQSTWSHAALYIGKNAVPSPFPDAGLLVEADLVDGVVAVPLSKYAGRNTRICRPIGLSQADCSKVVDFMIRAIGRTYDLKNLLDMVRYLVPLPVPARWRRRMIALGSGDPTRAICSTLIAQAFQQVHYPILPRVERIPDCHASSRYKCEILHIRHHSLFSPRDFDLSPYFAVVKPSLELGFNYRKLVWDEPDQTREGLKRIA